MTARLVRSRLFREPMTLLTVHEAVGADGRLTRISEESEVLGAFRQRSAIDSFNAGVVVTDEVIAYLPPDTATGVGDRLVVRDATYEVTSTAFPQVNLRTGEAHHVEVRLRRSQR